MPAAILPAETRTTGASPAGLGTWVLGIAVALLALAADARSHEAALLLSRCRLDGWVDTLRPSAWPAHVSAFRWTMAWMLALALWPALPHVLSGQWRRATALAVRHVGAMTLAMVPACALAAALAAPLALRWADGSAAFVYGATMLLASNALSSLRLAPRRLAA